MYEFSGYFYVNLGHGEFMHPCPIYDSMEWIWRHAENSDWLIIFEMSIDEFNESQRIGQYDQDLEKADARVPSHSWYQRHRARR